ncbi:DNA-binding transcriptional regulator, LysR family [Amycolatopsis xylanica]|uniref:DNA-binding transcriptional regulator, LysR family n=1 Tax=Amycolatopsis xylanica TaxID=589385 RepID=A0A1H3RYH9_9PSEU|nr:LysR substrate-binding domain-containing protein [Amycolatopsis xylanica]SDZ30690.1 DNA-binding transcriptional regulator, LysR family [Amycolatopsis xylanica]
MELRQLEYFVAVAEEANFTRAAEKVHVAQPGVSAQIRRLERELGETLFDRSGRTVTLTEAGAAVLPYMRAALEAVAGAKQAVDELTGLLRGRVAVGMVTSCRAGDLPDLLADFHKNHPAVEITLSEANSDVLVASLLAGALDLALIGSVTGSVPGLETSIVTDEPIVAAVARSDSFADRAAVPLVDLRDRSLICLPKGTGMRAALDEAAAVAGFEPRIAFEASDPGVLADLAGRGLGVAILPSSLAETRRDLHSMSITEPGLRGTLALAWRAEGPRGPAARALVEHARSPRAGSSIASNR